MLNNCKYNYCKAMEQLKEAKKQIEGSFVEHLFKNRNVVILKLVY